MCICKCTRKMAYFKLKKKKLKEEELFNKPLYFNSMLFQNFSCALTVIIAI